MIRIGTILELVSIQTRPHEHYNVYVLLGFLWCICTDLKTGATCMSQR